jgi:hypothetical protein
MICDHIINDPDEMVIARKASWLCKLFQFHKLNVDDKQSIIRNLIKKHKEERIKNGQGH